MNVRITLFHIDANGFYCNNAIWLFGEILWTLIEFLNSQPDDRAGRLYFGNRIRFRVRNSFGIEKACQSALQSNWIFAVGYARRFDVGCASIRSQTKAGAGWDFGGFRCWCRRNRADLPFYNVWDNDGFDKNNICVFILVVCRRFWKHGCMKKRKTNQKRTTSRIRPFNWFSAQLSFLPSLTEAITVFLFFKTGSAICDKKRMQTRGNFRGTRCNILNKKSKTNMDHAIGWPRPHQAHILCFDFRGARVL